MKNKKIYLAIALLAVLTISIIEVVQAHSQTTYDTQEYEWYEYMEKMHEEMTQDFNQVTEKTTDQMHSFCERR